MSVEGAQKDPGIRLASVTNPAPNQAWDANYVKVKDQGSTKFKITARPQMAVKELPDENEETNNLTFESSGKERTQARGNQKTTDIFEQKSKQNSVQHIGRKALFKQKSIGKRPLDSQPSNPSPSSSSVQVVATGLQEEDPSSESTTGNKQSPTQQKCPLCQHCFEAG